MHIEYVTTRQCHSYLILVGAIDVLPRLFSEIHAPTQVIEELKQSRAPEAVKRWGHAPPQWLHISAPFSVVVTSVRLDPGEAQAIALAKELRAEAILIDERLGRRVAKEHGLDAIGTLAVLEFAAERTLLDLEPTLEALRRTTFYITDAYIHAALERDAARKKR